MKAVIALLAVLLVALAIVALERQSSVDRLRVGGQESAPWRGVR